MCSMCLCVEKKLSLFLKFFKHCIKNIVPKRVTYPKTFIVLLIMVHHVVILHFEPKRIIPSYIVHRKVHHIVAQISQHEARKKRKY